MKFLTALTGLLVILLSSCTLVTATNVPGKKATKVPKNMLGQYELHYPESIAAMMEGSDAKTIVIFENDRMTVRNTDGDNISMLGDSLFISTIKKQTYLSMGAPPSVIVFKIVKKGKDMELYPMFCNEEVTANLLEPYFSKVTEVEGEMDENGEMGASTYEVTIDDTKLDKFFTSEIALKDPFILKKTK